MSPTYLITHGYGHITTGIGTVAVTRSYPNNQGGYTWTVTYLTVVGNIPQVTAKSYLVSLGANVTVNTLQQGNQIDGTFTVSFQVNLPPSLCR